MKSLQGHILIAPPALRDPNFAQTVVLMIQHSEEGALGLVLNRPLETSVRDAVQEVISTPCNYEGPLHQGGPCQGPLMVVHTQADAGEIEVFEGVYFTTAQEKVQWLMEYNTGSIKYFSGYAGWAAGQLEAELEAGGWYVAMIDAAHIFAADEDPWQQLVARITLGSSINPKIIPKDPQLN
jgi:putative transcriptional regulator